MTLADLQISNLLPYHPAHAPKFGSSGWDRTTDILINSQTQLPLCY
jgi:hypothetical protein